LFVLLGLTACAPTPSRTPARQQGETASRYTLAVFPWSITGDYEVAVSEVAGKNALQAVLPKFPFVLTFSHYRLRQHPAAPLPLQEFPEAAHLWHQKAPGNAPDLALLLPLATRLQVDAVLMYVMDSHYGPDYLWVYLIDVAQHKTYVISDETVEYNEHALWTLREMTERVFAAFLNGRS
jgi:hypothetical protein